MGVRLKLSLLGFLLPFLLSPLASAAIPTKPQVALTWKQDIEKPVRVRLAQDLSRLTIQGLGVHVTPKPSEALANHLGSITVERVKTEVGWFWKIQSPQSEKNGKGFILRSGAQLIIEGIDLRRGGQDLPGRLVLAAKIKGFDLIGVLPLENYLVGVLASEMPLAWPLEALKAQAVAARSYTLAVMRDRRRLAFDVESSILDQVFNHISRRLDDDKMIQKAKRAVSETSGVVLLGSRSQVAKAYYHADCGGRTSSEKSVWGVGDKTTFVTDSSCPGHPRSKWSMSLSETELRGKLAKRFQISKQIASLLPIPAQKGDRASRLKLRFDDGSEKTLNAGEFREALGYSTLRSTFFQVEKNGDEFEFRGQGWGHGVGLCQWGSRKLADMGRGALEILKHYYPATQVVGDIRNSPTVALRRTEPQR